MNEFKNEQDFLASLVNLSTKQQEKVLNLTYDFIFENLDDHIYRVMATSIKYAKDNDIEGHEEFGIKTDDLKLLSNIQDNYRQEAKMKESDKKRKARKKTAAKKK